MTPPESRVALLRRRAVESLESTKFSMEAEQLLERLVEVAMEGSEDALFAHQELATLQLERSPWNAALHLRKVLAGRPDDHAAHALMGLSQALLSNFRMAIASYERAIALAPDVPGYHHNVGHFLDVAMEQAGRALPFLQKAHALAPANHEITASLAHCLARTGQLAEAEALAEDAVERAPDEPGHRSLLVWIQGGAPQRAEPLLAKAPAVEVTELPKGVDRWGDVLQSLRRDAQNVPAALKLAASVSEAGLPWTNALALAAAIDYLSAEGESQRTVAQRHGVSVSALGRRVATVRGLLRAELR